MKSRHIVGAALAALLILGGIWVLCSTSMAPSDAWQPSMPPFTRGRLFNGGPPNITRVDVWQPPQVPANPQNPTSWGGQDQQFGGAQNQSLLSWSPNAQNVGAVAVRVTWGNGTTTFAYAAAPAGTTVMELFVVAQNGPDKGKIAIGCGGSGASMPTAWANQAFQ